jgi:hypothetical protein
MATEYKCSFHGERHVFADDSPDYEEVLKYPGNEHGPMLCPYDGSPLTLIFNTTIRVESEFFKSLDKEQSMQPTGLYRGLLTIVADVSGSMFHSAKPNVRPSIEPVIEALAEVLWAMALPTARTRGTLLSFIVFSANARYLVLRPGVVVEAKQVVESSFSFEERITALPTISEFVEILHRERRGSDPFLLTNKDDELAALRESFTEAFKAANAICGGNHTNYEAPLQRCRDLLNQAKSPEERLKLRDDWGEVEKDLREIPFIRTIFYSDGAPNQGATSERALELLSRETFVQGNRQGTDLTSLCMTASFPGSDKQDEIDRADRLLTFVASDCPVPRHNVKCCFPAELAPRFREILRLTSGGGGYCPMCLPQ